MIKLLPCIKFVFSSTVRVGCRTKLYCIFYYTDKFIQIINGNGRVCNYNGLDYFNHEKMSYGLTGCRPNDYKDYVERIVKEPDLL